MWEMMNCKLENLKCVDQLGGGGKDGREILKWVSGERK
jgi:hypothetical protein